MCPDTWTRHGAGVTCRLADCTLDLAWYGPDTVRVRAWRGTEPKRRSLSVIAEPVAPEGWEAVAVGDGVEMRGPRLAARVGGDGVVSFWRDGRPLLAEKRSGRAFPPNDLPNPEDQHGAAQAFLPAAGEALYGLGQFQDGVMNWRGHEVTLIQGNVVIVVPFLVSTGGWGILWDNPSHSVFRDGPDGMALRSEVADGVDYYLCAGDTPDAAIAGYRRLTGVAPLPPRAFLGLIQSKERYQTADELVEVVREHRRRGLPLDVIVQDWLYWGKGMERWSGMRHDPATYGDLPGAVRAIHDLHARVMISIWPRIGVGTDLGRELAAAGHLFAGRPKDWDKVYDAFSEPARAIYWRHVRDGLLSLGVDAWWMDGTEPEFVDCHDVLQHKRASLAQRDTAAGSWARVLNAYSLATTGGVYERQRAEGADRRVFILTRSAFAGQQRYGTAVWSGDIGASWRTFAAQIPAGLNCCAAGIPYWTTDTGGFFVRGRGGTFPEGVADPAFRELYLRWFQFSCFCPLMRSHGTQTPREIWRFGEPGDPVYEALAAFARLRMRLLPYSYSVAAMATADGYTPMRALGLDFPADSAAHAVADQFGWGPALMACPVTFPMVHMPRERLDAFRPGDLTEPDGSSGALEMAVFDGPLAAEPAHRQRMIVVDCSWSGNRPAGASGDAYRVEVRGHLRVAAGESRAILVRAAGRLRVEIGGRVAADDADAAPLHEHRIETGAWRGQSVALRVAYWHVEGDAVLQVGWEARPAVAAAAPVPRERDVYLPPAPWHDFWTGERLAGPGRVRRPAPLDILPLLVRGGSILPLGPVKQWHDETPDDPLELRVYPGADGAFTLYEDAGDGYGYERGQSSRIPLTWDDARGVLRIGERQGQFPGMLARREFRIVRVRPGHGTGIGVCPAPHRVVAYDGGRQDVVPA